MEGRRGQWLWESLQGLLEPLEDYGGGHDGEDHVYECSDGDDDEHMVGRAARCAGELPPPNLLGIKGLLQWWMKVKPSSFFTFFAGKDLRVLWLL